MKSGASQTMRSRHITGHAVDLGAYVAGQVRWDWPLYHKIADTMKKAAEECNVPIEWGGRLTGVIAQEVQAGLPEAVTVAEDEMKTLSVTYGNMVGLLIEAIKELKAEVDTLKAKVG